MKLTDLKGGLGNQMFQYARARACAREKTISLNVYELEHSTPGDTPRSFALGDFTLGPIEIVRKPRTLQDRVTNRLMRTLQPDWGYFQSEDYFTSETDRIRQEFSLRTPLAGAALIYAEKIAAASNAVSIHVRHGDYIKNPRVLYDFGVCSLPYYERAIALMRERVPAPQFFIFSDDLSWCRENLSVDQDAVFVEGAGLTDTIELTLMSECAHNIIANSSFSWWGAWLNPNPDKIVIAPTPWFDRAPYNKRIIPQSWTQLPK